MTDTDMLYMASLEKKNNDLEAKVAELEGKHWNECGQIAHYSDENAKLKELLRKAVEDFPDLTDMWRYAVETLKLIGGLKMTIDEARKEIPDFDTFANEFCNACTSDTYCSFYCDTLKKAEHIFDRVQLAYARHDGDMIKVDQYIKSTKG